MLVNSSSGLCPLPGFAHSWAHARAQPCLDGPTAQGVPSIQAPSRPLEQGHRCGRSPARSPLQGPTLEKILEEPSTSLREVGQPGRAGFSLLPASRHLSCFTKPGRKEPKESYFVNWPFAGFRSPPGMFPNVFPRSPLPRQPKHNTNKQK